MAESQQLTSKTSPESRGVGEFAASFRKQIQDNRVITPWKMSGEEAAVMGYEERKLKLLRRR